MSLSGKSMADKEQPSASAIRHGAFRALTAPVLLHVSLLRTSSSRMTICRWMRKSQPGVLSFLPMKMIRDCLPEHLNTALPTIRPKRWKLYFRTTVIISPIATTRHRGRSSRLGTDSSLRSAPETNRVMNIVNLRSLPTIRRP